MTINFNLKYKTISILFLAIVFSLLLVWLILNKILQETHIEDAAKRSHEAHETLIHSLQVKGELLSYLAKTITKDSEIIPALNMISEYQNIEDYKPIIFDTEKQQLAIILQKHAEIAKVDMLSIYDKGNQLVAYSLRDKIGFVAGFSTYEGGKSTIYQSAFRKNEEWLHASLPNYLTATNNISSAEYGKIHYLTIEKNFGMWTSLPITRTFPDKTTKVIGSVQTMTLLDDDFIKEIVMNSGLDFQLLLNDGSKIGNIENLKIPKQILQHSHPIFDKHGPQDSSVDHLNYFLHIHFLELPNSAKIYFIFATNKSLLMSELRKLQQTLSIVFFLSAFILIPIFIFIANRMISKPVNSLLKGIKGFQNGEFDQMVPVSGEDELSLLGNTFNTMAVTIKTQIQDLQKAHDSLEAQVAARTKELELQKGFLEGVLENIKDGIVACDKDGILSLFNRATKIFHGVDQQQLQPEEWSTHYNLYLADGVTPMRKEDIPLFRAFQGEEVNDFEMVIAPKQGLKRTVLASGKALIDNTGFKYGAVASMHDITEEKLAVEALKEIHRNLEKKVEERTVELKESYEQLAKEVADRKGVELQLRQAHKMEAIGTLAGGIAHDFNNILTPILGYAEMVQEELPEGSQLWSNQNEIITAGTRAKELVQQILTFSRQTGFERKPIQVHLLVKEAIKLLRSSIPTTIEIKQNIDPQCGTILADPTQIHQVVVNLCTNAYHAMQKTGGTLAISLKRVEIGDKDYSVNLQLHPGFYVNLEVSDTGIGIPLEVKEKIFDPYFTTKKQGEGTGLGLSVVLGIVESLQGHITVYSEPGQGTTFHVYLPAIDVEPDLKKTISVADIPHGSERILFVDDEEVIVRMQKTMLESLGYQVSTFTSSHEAFKIFQQQPDNFDLIISDMTMPNMTGAELAQKLICVRPDVPIILCTGFSQLINEEKAKVLGIREFIMKPILKLDIAKAIRRVLDEKKA